MRPSYSSVSIAANGDSSAGGVDAALGAGVGAGFPGSALSVSGVSGISVAGVSMLTPSTVALPLAVEAGEVVPE